MEQVRKLNRRDFLRWSAMAAAASALAACAPAAPATKVAVTSAPAEATTAVGATAAPQATAAPAANVELRWADWPDMVGTKEAADKFQQDNPGVTVTFEAFGDSFDQKLMAQCVAGTAPDVLSIFGYMFFAFADKGQILDLKPFVDKNMTKGDVDDFFPWHWPNGFTVPETGQLCGMPWKINITALAFNKDAFDEVGVAYPTESWDHANYADAMRKLLKTGDGGKVERYGGMIPAWDQARFLCHVQAYGGHMVDPKDRTKCLLGEKEAQEALEWLRKAFWDDKVLVPDWGQVSNLGGIGPVFIQGKCATVEEGLSAIGYDLIEATKSSPNPIKWGVMHMPKGPAGRFALGSTDGYAIYKNSKNAELAWKFSYFLSQDLYQKANVIEYQRQLPPRRSQFKYFDEIVVTPWQEKGIDMSIFTKALEMGYPRPEEAFVKQQESGVILQEALDKVFGEARAPVTEFIAAAEKINAANKAS